MWCLEEIVCYMYKWKLNDDDLLSMNNDDSFSVNDNNSLSINDDNLLSANMLESYSKNLETHRSELTSLFKKCISQNIVWQLNVKTLRMCLMNQHWDIKNALDELIISRWAHFYIERLFFL